MLSVFFIRLIDKCHGTFFDRQMYVPMYHCRFNIINSCKVSICHCNTSIQNFSIIFFYRLGDLNNLFTMPPPQGIPPKQDLMCSCSISDIVKAFGVCNGTDTETCSKAYSCQRNDRVSVPLLSFEMDITDIILSNMLLGFQSRLYVFPWDDASLLRTELRPFGSRPQANIRTNSEAQCARKISNILFAVLCRESLRIDLDEISSLCPEALKARILIIVPCYNHHSGHFSSFCSIKF